MWVQNAAYFKFFQSVTNFFTPISYGKNKRSYSLYIILAIKSSLTVTKSVMKNYQKEPTNNKVTVIEKPLLQQKPLIKDF